MPKSKRMIVIITNPCWHSCISQKYKVLESFSWYQFLSYKRLDSDRISELHIFQIPLNQRRNIDLRMWPQIIIKTIVSNRICDISSWWIARHREIIEKHSRSATKKYSDILMPEKQVFSQEVQKKNLQFEVRTNIIHLALDSTTILFSLWTTLSSKPSSTQRYKIIIKIIQHKLSLKVMSQSSAWRSMDSISWYDVLIRIRKFASMQKWILWMDRPTISLWQAMVWPPPHDK